MTSASPNGPAAAHTISARDYFIPDVFRERVHLHVLKNYFATFIRPSLILAIQGPAGCGKSFQALRACEDRAINVVTLSGAALSGEREHDPVRVLFEAYGRASEEGQKKERPSVLLIDDFHLSAAATYGTRQYTVNTQLLIGALMNLADHPDVCGQKTVTRTPIIATGNDFTTLYQPLIRHGRVDVFDWHPNSEMILPVLRKIYSLVLREDETDRLSELVAAHPDESIAFFVALRGRLMDGPLLDLLRTGGKLSVASCKEAVKKCRRSFTVDDLLAGQTNSERRGPGTTFKCHPGKENDNGTQHQRETKC